MKKLCIFVAMFLMSAGMVISAQAAITVDSMSESSTSLSIDFSWSGTWTDSQGIPATYWYYSFYTNRDGSTDELTFQGSARHGDDPHTPSVEQGPMIIVPLNFQRTATGVFNDSIMMEHASTGHYDTVSLVLNYTGGPAGGGYGSGTGTLTASHTTSIVPEPVSSTLFIVGAAALGFRRFRKKFKK